MSSQEVERSIKGESDETGPKGGRLQGVGGGVSVCILEVMWQKDKWR